MSNGSTPPAIEVEDLVKTFGDVDAVRGVSFSVPPGEVFGFLGPNGAGKSTTINVLCTLARPTSGTARVSGFDVVTRRDDVRRHIGLVFQDPTLDLQLTVEQTAPGEGVVAEVPGVREASGELPGRRDPEGVHARSGAPGTGGVRSSGRSVSRPVARSSQLTSRTVCRER